MNLEFHGIDGGKGSVGIPSTNNEREKSENRTEIQKNPAPTSIRTKPRSWKYFHGDDKHHSECPTTLQW
jgi:hypothetical protein